MIANYRQAVQVAEPEPEVNYVEFIRSTGTQYIDTGFKPNSNTRVVIDIQVTKAGTYAIFGGRQAYKNTAFAFWVMAEDEWKTDFGNGELQIPSSNTLNRVVIDKNKNVCYVGSSSYTNTSASFSSPSSLTLFAVKDGDGSVDDRMSSFKLYSCQIYDNDILVRDYTPALDPDGVPCLYDKVSKEYVYNSGTGSFLYPSNNVNFVEYIRSSGTQYIDTGFKPNNNTRVIIDVEFLDTSFPKGVFGGRDATGANKNSFCLWRFDDYIRFDYNNSSMEVPCALSGRFYIDTNKNTCRVNNGSAYSHSSASFQAQNNLVIFGINGLGVIDTRKVSARLYSCKIYDNEALTRDYAPALDPEGIACLYEKLSEQYVYNSGSGSFTAPS